MLLKSNLIQIELKCKIIKIKVLILEYTVILHNAD